MFPDPTEKSSGTLKVRAGVLRERKKIMVNPWGEMKSYTILRGISLTRYLSGQC